MYVRISCIICACRERERVREREREREREGERERGREREGERERGETKCLPCIFITSLGLCCAALKCTKARALIASLQVELARLLRGKIERDDTCEHTRAHACTRAYVYTHCVMSLNTRSVMTKRNQLARGLPTKGA